MESNELSREQHRELDSLRGILRNISFLLFLLAGVLCFGAFFRESPGRAVLYAVSALLLFILGILGYSASVSFRRSLTLEERDPEQFIYALKDLKFFLAWFGWILLGLFLVSFFGAFALLLS
ncbi:hypothetical protein ACE5IS_13240 [Leptospira wolffii]|uniref:DUF202 domain-containing protein n=1 Tax=Leptospira wolffii TaxID=409998 RepID=A0A2M9ZA43_9LEPT|nr:hypothetical protein [Leptospira wolffii]EPG66655.1 hypothetical protein LEP1GSC061_1894 [Leptospira wolffii serovar Khorat str. Khorat-H2]PJZ65232.1 hypothetical protein CH371_14105 [Leptospira wolffii]TGK56814.1 hypothetical protein EHQ32_14600 [Leptospira wolffii]TGK71604.1 hypothetical protein EHQ27_09930 [Leptospira wolffii]TGK75539.1 hypothetical protein EHQ35_03975 [Leptospira wolffii]